MSKGGPTQELSSVVSLEEVRAALDLDRLLSDARSAAQWSDFGNEDFCVALGKLIETAMSDLVFRSAGLTRVRGDLLRALVNRLRYQRDLTAHPEILEEDVSDPLVITGMPRTGTTKLQRIMSADPGMQALWTWRVMYPAPVPGASPGGPDPRIRLTGGYQEEASQFNTSHETLTEDAEEDLFLIIQSFENYKQVSLTPTHGFLRWVRQRPRETSYRYLKRMLQYLQWQNGGKQGRPWVLKGPGHVGSIDVLCDVFPNATILYSHRDMTHAIPSYCLLMYSIWRTHFANITPEWVGQHALEFYGIEQQRYMKLRQRDRVRSRLMEVPYLDVVRDPLRIAAQFYAMAGLNFNETSRSAMLRWLSENPQHKHGKPDYSLDRFGLTPDMIAHAFPTVDLESHVRADCA